MSARQDRTDDRWSGLGRGQLIAFGRTKVIDRLQEIGCTIEDHPTAGPLPVTTPSGREVEVFISTQRLGGYAFWTKRRLQPASDRFAAIVLLSDGEEPEIFCCRPPSGATPRRRSGTATTSASAASPSTASRWRGHRCPRCSGTRGTRPRLPSGSADRRRDLGSTRRRDQSATDVGSRAETVVPVPGGLSIATDPPSASRRSANPVRPEPAAGSAPPRPSSATVSSSTCPRWLTLTRTCVAPACLAVLASASETV